MLTRQAFYTRFDPHPDGTNCFDRTQANSMACSQSYENSIVFLMSLGQFLIAAFVFNKGPPFRRPIYTNLWLLLGESGGSRNGAMACRAAGARAQRSPLGAACHGKRSGRSRWACASAPRLGAVPVLAPLCQQVACSAPALACLQRCPSRRCLWGCSS